MGRDDYLDYPWQERRAHELAKHNKFTFSLHALDEMRDDRVTRQEIRHVLSYGSIIPERTRFELEQDSPSYAFEGKTWEGRRLRIAAAILDRLLVVTVMDLDK